MFDLCKLDVRSWPQVMSRELIGEEFNSSVLLLVKVDQILLAMGGNISASYNYIGIDVAEKQRATEDKAYTGTNSNMQDDCWCPLAVAAEFVLDEHVMMVFSLSPVRTLLLTATDLNARQW